MGGVLLTSFSNLLNSKYSKQYEINFKDYFYLYDPFPGKKESFLKSGYKNYLDSEGEVLENSKIICIWEITQMHLAISKEVLITF